MAETSDSQLSEARTLREIGYVTEVQEQIKKNSPGKQRTKTADFGKYRYAYQLFS